MQIEIYFSDLKPEKQQELCNQLHPVFSNNPKPIPSPLAIVVLEDEDAPDDASERLEQEAQWRAENQIPEPEKEDRGYPF
jgi:hypothetical protein